MMLAKRKIRNGPDTSGLLKLPLEVREQIYGYLFVQELPMLLYRCLRSFCTPTIQSHSLFFSCRQIHDEASVYLYQNNVFMALVLRDRLHHTHCKLAPRFLPLLKNVVIECRSVEPGISSAGWAKHAAGSIDLLVGARARLNSFTIVFPPSILLFGTSSWEHLLPAIKGLKCKTFRAVLTVEEEVNMPALLFSLLNLGPWGHWPGSGNPRKPARRMLVEFDLRPLYQDDNNDDSQLQSGGKISNAGSYSEHQSANRKMASLKVPALKNAESSTKRQVAVVPRYQEIPAGRLDLYPSVIALRNQRKAKAKADLHGLKRLLKEICRNPDAAVRQGKCRVMGPREFY